MLPHGCVVTTSCYKGIKPPFREHIMHHAPDTQGPEQQQCAKILCLCMSSRTGLEDQQLPQLGLEGLNNGTRVHCSKQSGSGVRQNRVIRRHNQGGSRVLPVGQLSCCRAHAHLCLPVLGSTAPHLCTEESSAPWSYDRVAGGQGRDMECSSWHLCRQVSSRVLAVLSTHVPTS